MEEGTRGGEPGVRQLAQCMRTSIEVRKLTTVVRTTSATVASSRSVYDNSLKRWSATSGLEASNWRK